MPKEGLIHFAAVRRFSVACLCGPGPTDPSRSQDLFALNPDLVTCDECANLIANRDPNHLFMLTPVVGERAASEDVKRDLAAIAAQIGDDHPASLAVRKLSLEVS